MGMLDPALLALPGARRVFGLLAACALLDAALGVGLSLGVACAVATLWGGAPFTQVLTDGSLAAFAGCFAARRLLGFVRDTQMDAFAARTVCELRRDLAGALWDAGARAVRGEGSGATCASLLSGMDDIERYVAIALPKAADLMVATTVFVVALFFVDWPSSVVAVCSLPFVVVFMRMLGSAAKDEAAKRHGEFRVLTNHFVDSLRGAETLRAFGALERQTDEVYEKSERLRETTVETIAVASRSSLVLDLLATFALAASAILLGFRLISGSVEILPALAALVLVPETFGPARRFASDFHATLDGRNALAAVGNLRERVAAAIDAKTERVDVSAWDESSTLVLDGVGFSYGMTSAEDAPAEAPDTIAPDNVAPDRDTPDKGAPIQDARGEDERDRTAALDSICLRFEGFTKVGVVGESGSGKSTLANIVAGIERPCAGTVRIEGAGGSVTLTSLDNASWQKQVAYISQKPYIFAASLRDNIALFKPRATDDEVLAAVRAAGLDDLVAQLPHGLSTKLGEGGRALSGGQAQRVVLARAFVDESRRVLVFDEPTAHLDIETEYDLAQRMLPLMEGRLVFFATHRLHWLRHMDAVVVLQDGRVVETGTFDELVAANGTLCNLVAQMRGESR